MAKNKKTKAVKPIVKADGLHDCPQGQVWSPSQGKCVDDVGK